jgi:hypothetical protein
MANSKLSSIDVPDDVAEYVRGHTINGMSGP